MKIKRKQQTLCMVLVAALMFYFMSYSHTAATTTSLPPPPPSSVALSAVLAATTPQPSAPRVITTPTLPKPKPTKEALSKYFAFSPHKRYFFYQPSGGWGNQRFILRWAILAANAMNRTLAVCPMAPHSDIWHGYNNWQKHEIVPADRLLDTRALNEAVDQGVVFLDDIPARIVQRIENETSLTVRIFVKGHYVNRFAAEKKLLVYHESDITRDWLAEQANIVFWDKMSMWQCCITDYSPDQIWIGKHIMFNSFLKRLVLDLTQRTFGPERRYNAVHIRRGDMSISADRRTAEVYYKKHQLHMFDKTLPLYVATNERNSTWFDFLRTKFPRLYFWKDLDFDRTVLKSFPETMQGDISGFIDMLVCGNAVKWEGSKKSTFSTAIGAIRLSKQLRELDWEFEMKPSYRAGVKQPMVGQLPVTTMLQEEETEHGDDEMMMPGDDDQEEEDDDEDGAESRDAEMEIEEELNEKELIESESEAAAMQEEKESGERM